MFTLSSTYSKTPRRVQAAAPSILKTFKNGMIQKLIYLGMIGMFLRDPIVEYHGHQKRLLAIRIESTDRFMFSAGQDFMMNQWEITSGKLVRTFQGHAKNINVIIFSSDEQYILTASSDNTAKMWVMESGENISNTSTIDTVIFNSN